MRLQMTKRMLWVSLCGLAMLLLAVSLVLARRPSCRITFTDKGVPLAGALMTLDLCQGIQIGRHQPQPPQSACAWYEHSCFLDEQGCLQLTWPWFKRPDTLILATIVKKDGKRFGGIITFGLPRARRCTIDFDLSAGRSTIQTTDTFFDLGVFKYETVNSTTFTPVPPAAGAGK